MDEIYSGKITNVQALTCCCNVMTATMKICVADLTKVFSCVKVKNVYYTFFF